MSTLANITSLNLSLQTGGAALAVKAVESIIAPARRLYVFGGASGVFPYFSTFASALTYANSLTPTTTNPVSIVLLSNTNGTPVEISGASDWYALCLAGINVSSPYREIFSTTTLPTTLPKGMRVMYVGSGVTDVLYVGDGDGLAKIDGIPVFDGTTANYNDPVLPTESLKNGESLVFARSGFSSMMYLGNDENSPRPAVGYYEYTAQVSQTGTNAPTAFVLINTLGGPIVFERTEVGSYTITHADGWGTTQPRMVYLLDDLDINERLVVSLVKTSNNVYTINTLRDGAFADGILDDFLLSIKSYA